MQREAAFLIGQLKTERMTANIMAEEKTVHLIEDCDSVAL